MRYLALLLLAACATSAPYVRKLPTVIYKAPPEKLYDVIYRSLIPVRGQIFLKWPPDLFWCLHVQLVAAGDGWRIELHGQGKQIQGHRRDVPSLEEMLTIDAPPKTLSAEKAFLDHYDHHFAALLARYAAR